MKYVLLVVGEPSYYTGLRMADNGMYLPSDPYDPHVMTEDYPSSFGSEQERLRRMNFYTKIIQLEEA